MLGIEKDLVFIQIPRAPNRCRSVPAHIQGVTAWPISWNFERFADDFGFRHGINRAGAELGYSLGPRIALIGRNRRIKVLLSLLIEMGHVIPACHYDILTHDGIRPSGR